MCIKFLTFSHPPVLRTSPFASKGDKRGVQHGFTLIELIVIVIVVSIVAVALFGVFTKSVASSADPMLRMQAVAIAQGYLDEALLKAFTDPNGGENNRCEEGSDPAVSGDRQGYDDVRDYNCIVNQAPEDQYGTALVDLGGYSVNMTTAGITVNTVALQQVTVTVSLAGQTIVSLTGYRANY
jgi:MSHA pilin protein MshD